MSGMKTGVSRTDQKKVARYIEMGYGVREISEMLYIRPEVIERFAPEKQKEADKKTKAANKKAEAEHKKVMAAKKTPAIDPQAPKPDSE